MLPAQPQRQLVGSSAVSLMADEIALQADADLRRSLGAAPAGSASPRHDGHSAAASVMAACGCKACRPAPAPFSTAYTSSLDRSLTSRGSSLNGSTSIGHSGGRPSTYSSPRYVGTAQGSPRVPVQVGEMTFVVPLQQSSPRGSAATGRLAQTPRGESPLLRKMYVGSPRTPSRHAATNDDEVVIEVAGGVATRLRDVAHSVAPTVDGVGDAAAVVAASIRPNINE